MNKYPLLGAFLALAAWSGSYAPAATLLESTVQIGSAAQAGVRWTPDPDRGSASSTLSGGRRGAAASVCGLKSEEIADMEFVLLDPVQASPIYSKSIQARSGLIEVTLPALAALEVGVPYRWTVFVTCKDGENQVHARGFVERVNDSELHKAK